VNYREHAFLKAHTGKTRHNRRPEIPSPRPAYPPDVMMSDAELEKCLFGQAWAATKGDGDADSRD
jgi:hypothetical protein